MKIREYLVDSPGGAAIMRFPADNIVASVETAGFNNTRRTEKCRESDFATW